MNEPSLRQTLERSEPDLDAPAQTLRRGIVYTPPVFGKSIVPSRAAGSVTIDVSFDNAQFADPFAAGVGHLEAAEILAFDSKPREHV